MTNADAKQYLNQVYDLELSINSKLEQIKQLEDKATRITASLKSDIVQSASDNNGFADIANKIVDMHRLLLDEQGRQLDLIAEIRQLIVDMSVEHPALARILEARYLLHKKWILICYEQHYSWQHMLALHSKALTIFKQYIRSDIIRPS